MGKPANPPRAPAWNTPLPSQGPRPSAPSPYRSGLAPSPSQLRPHCLARDRLRIWRPLQARTILDEQGVPTNLSPDDLTRIADVLEHTWAENTRETYGTGLLLFHIFCDKKNLPETQRAPASGLLLSAFTATLTGSYASKSIGNYLYGVRAWHIIHGISWHPNELETQGILKAANALRPASSKRKPRLPFTVDYILALRSQFDLSVPLDAAVFSCLTTTFYSAARLGEFTVKNLKPGTFRSSTHVTPTHISSVVDRNDLGMTSFHLPRTKTSSTGEDVSWARQLGLSDPEAALNNHLQINQPPADGPLFAYRHGKGFRALTKTKMLECLSKAARSLNVDPLQGHGIRIGSTLEYLLRGVPFEVVKAKGRWASDSFLLYLRRHAQIMAPYMQAAPALHESVIRYSMPPVR
jgi:hypothetical protein